MKWLTGPHVYNLQSNKLYCSAFGSLSEKWTHAWAGTCAADVHEMQPAFCPMQWKETRTIHFQSKQNATVQKGTTSDLSYYQSETTKTRGRGRRESPTPKHPHCKRLNADGIQLHRPPTLDMKKLTKAVWTGCRHVENIPHLQTGPHGDIYCFIPVISVSFH